MWFSEASRNTYTNQFEILDVHVLKPIKRTKPGVFRHALEKHGDTRKKYTFLIDTLNGEKNGARWGGSAFIFSFILYARIAVVADALYVIPMQRDKNTRYLGQTHRHTLLNHHFRFIKS